MRPRAEAGSIAARPRAMRGSARMIGPGFAAWALTVWAGCRSADRGPAALSVDGEPVAAEAFLQALADCRSSAYAMAVREGGNGSATLGWTAGPRGRRPVDVAVDSALARCVRDQTLLRLARDSGLVGDISYPAYLREWRAENARRAADRARGRPVYGPVRFDSLEYWSVRQSRLEEALHGKLAATPITPAESLGALAALPPPAPELRLRAFILAPTRAGSAESLRQSLLDGRRGTGRADPPVLKVVETALRPGTLEAGRHWPDSVQNLLRSLPVGGVSPVLTGLDLAGAGGGPIVVRLLDRKPGTVLPPARLTQAIQALVRNRRYDSLFARRLAAARIACDTPAWLGLAEARP